MKKRKGFVSNSSVSSFCIFGTILSEESLEEIGVKLGEDNDILGFISGMIEDKKLNLEVECPFKDDYYVGRSWRKVEDDQTGREFKEDIKKQIMKLIGKDVQLKTFEEAWQDS